MECALVVQAVAVASFGPLAPKRMRDMPGGKVNDRGRNKERRDLARAAFEQGLSVRAR